MDIDVHEHTTIGLFIELCEIALLVVSVLVVGDEEFCCSDGGTRFGRGYVLSMQDCP